VPLYEYECVKCHHRFEKIERVTASAEKTCPACGGKAERLLASPAIQFKGSGWYVTDYARQGTSSQAKEKDKADGRQPAREAGESKETPAKKEKEKSSK
jgi:putative FmdB family regulatory protein